MCHGLPLDDLAFAATHVLPHLNGLRLVAGGEFRICRPAWSAHVHDIETDAKDQGIVDAVVRMAQGCRLDVIAEGIETGAQADDLQGRVSEGQGYLFGKPMRFEEFGSICRMQSSSTDGSAWEVEQSSKLRRA